MSYYRNLPCPCKSGRKTKKCCAINCCEVCLFSRENLGAIEAGWVLQRSLVRQNGKYHLPVCSSLLKFHPKTIVINGNGSVYWQDPERPNTESNAWDIIQKCVDKIKASPEGRGAGIPSEAMNFLHWLAATEKCVSYFTEECPENQDAFEATRQVHILFRKTLGESFQNADVHLRSLGCFHCETPHYLKPSEIESLGCLSLNWDGSVRKAPNTIELHGICELPETMVLPTQDLMRLLPRNKKITQGFEAFSVAHRWIGDCQNLIIWGCGLNDYDAIIPVLLSIFSLAKQKGRIRIFVSNPDSKNRQVIEKKLADYFPLATFCKCLHEMDL